LTEHLTCVVCGGAVGPDDGTCPTCSEPRVRICACTALVTLDHRECPSCGHVLPRFITMDERRRRKRRRNAWIAAGALALLAGAGAAVWPTFAAAGRARALLESGSAALREGRSDDAVRDLSDYVRRRPADPRGRHSLAVAHHARGDTEAGVDCARRALVADPACPGTHLALARHFESTRDVQEALRNALAAPEPEGRALAGRLLSALGRRVEAAAALDAASAAAPGDLDVALDAADAHAALGASDWAGAPEHRQRAAALLDDVVRRAEARLAASPGDAAAANAAVRALAARDGADPSVVDAAGRRAAAIAPDVLARVAWAEWLVRAGRREDAVSALGPAAAAGVAPAVQIRRARSLAAAAGVDAARRELEAALRLAPGDPGLAAALARVLIDAGRPSDALACITDARSAGSAGSVALLEIAGDAALAAGDSDLAEKQFVAWRGASPRDPRPLRRLLDLRMPAALAARHAGVPPDEHARTAVARLAELGDLDADDSRHLWWRTAWDDATGRHDEARRSVERLMRTHPDDPDVRALRIRRAFAFGAPRADSPEQVCDELRTAPPAPSDAHVFTESAMDAGRIDLALDAGGAAVERGDVDANVVDAVARALLAVGRPEAAADLCRRSPAGAGAELTTTRAVALALSGRADEAAALASGSSDAATIAGVARALGCVGRDDDARRLVVAARTHAGSDARLLAAVANAMDDLGLTEESREAWDAAERAAPGDDDLASRATVSLLLRPAPTEDERAVAARRVTEQRDRARSPLASMALRGVFALSRAENAVAVSDLRNALRALPERTDLQVALGRARARCGDFVAAANGLRDTLQRDPASVAARAALADTLTSLAWSALEEGRVVDASIALDQLAGVRGAAPVGAGLDPLPRVPDFAEAASRAALSARSDAAGPALLVALCEAARGESERAAVLALRVSESRADLPGGPAVLALVRRHAERPADAAAALGTALERGVTPADAALLEVLVGTDAPSAEAVESLRAAAGTSPDRPRLRSWLIAALVARGDRDAALAEFEALLARAPVEAFRWDLHAWGRDLAAAGRAGSARVALTRALFVAPTHADAAASREALSRLR
jgi:tetratricopeptide (TPR) repeat protein